MSYSFDMDGWDLFNTPFSAPVKTAPARQQAERSQQKPPEAAQRNTTPAEPTHRNPTPSQPQKTPPLSHQAQNTQQKQPAVKQPNPALSAPAPASDKKPAPKAVTPAPSQPAPTTHEPVDSTKAPANTQPAEPQKELVLDMSSDAAQDDTARCKAYEAAEAKRKAEWESKQKAKKLAEEAALQKLNSMSDADIIAAAAKRVSTDVEKITRRNMKECVAEHIQTLCKKDTAFARKTMHPSKNMIRCFKYINRMARDYVKQEMEDNDIKPDGNCYGTDIPDGLCYQWAEDYFNATNAPEDEATEEKFVPKPYVPAPPKKSKSDKKSDKKSKKQQKTQSDGYEQMSLEGVIG